MKARQIALLLALGTATVACADNQQSLFILHNQFGDDQCNFDPSAGDPSRPFGELDVATPGARYLLRLLLESGLSNPPNTETDVGNIVAIHGANLEILPVNNQESRDLVAVLAGQNLVTRNFRVSGSVGPGDLAAIAVLGLDEIQAAAFEAALADGQRTQIVIRAVVYGDVEGNSIESKPFDYPLTVCKNCSRVILGACSSLPTTYVGASSETCIANQDNFSECCTNAAGALVCPAAYEAPPPPMP